MGVDSEVDSLLLLNTEISHHCGLAQDIAQFEKNLICGVSKVVGGALIGLSQEVEDFGVGISGTSCRHLQLILLANGNKLV